MARPLAVTGCNSRIQADYTAQHAGRQFVLITKWRKFVRKYVQIVIVLLPKCFLRSILSAHG